MRSVKVDGPKLKQLRLLAGMTQEQLAKQLGYSDRLIRKLENGGPISRSARNDVLQFWQEYFALAGRNARSDLNIDLFASAEGAELEQQTRRWFDDVFNSRNLEPIDDLVHHDAVLLAAGKRFQGRDSIRQHFRAIFLTFESIHLTIERVHVDSSTAVVFWKAAMVQASEFAKVSSTPDTIDMNGSSLLRFEDQLIREIREHWNQSSV